MKEIDEINFNLLVPGSTNGDNGAHYKFLSNFVKQIGATKVLEIGTYTGLVPYCILRENPNVLVVSVDINNYLEINKSVGNQDFIVEFLKGNCNFSFIKGDSLSTEVVNSINRIASAFDVIFIDSAHDYKITKMEYDIYRRFAKQYMFVDDIHWLGMDKFWFELVGNKLDITRQVGRSGSCGFGVVINEGMLFDRVEHYKYVEKLKQTGYWSSDGINYYNMSSIPNSLLCLGCADTLSVDIDISNGHPGVAFNIVDINNYDVVYFRSTNMQIQVASVVDGCLLQKEADKLEGCGTIRVVVKILDKEVVVYVNEKIAMRYLIKKVTREVGLWQYNGCTTFGNVR